MTHRRTRNANFSLEELEARLTPVLGVAASAPAIGLGANGGEADGVVMLTNVEGLGSGSIMSTATHVLTAAHIIAEQRAPGSPLYDLLATTIDFEATRGGVPVPVTPGVVSVAGRIRIAIPDGADFLSVPTGVNAWSPLARTVHDIGIVSLPDQDPITRAPGRLMIAPFRATAFGGNRYELFGGDPRGQRFAMVGYGRDGSGPDGDYTDRVDRITIPAPLAGAANTFTLTAGGGTTAAIRQDTVDAVTIAAALNALPGLAGNVAVDYRGPGVWDVRFIKARGGAAHGGGITAVSRQDAGVAAVPLAPANRWPGALTSGTKRGGENEFDKFYSVNANVVLFDFDNTAAGVSAFGTGGLAAAETGAHSGDSGSPGLIRIGVVPQIAGVNSLRNNNPAQSDGGAVVDVTHYTTASGARWPDGSIGEYGGYTRIAPYLTYLNGRTTEQIDLILDMKYQTYGITGAGDNLDITVKNVGGYLEIHVAGVGGSADPNLDGMYYRAPAANIKSLTLRGSDDNETFRIVGDLGLANNGNAYIDGGSGTNSARRGHHLDRLHPADTS